MFSGWLGSRSMGEGFILLASLYSEIMRVKIGLCIVIAAFIFQSCNNHRKQKLPENFQYHNFKDSISRSGYDTTGDNSNVFDSTLFTPGIDSLNTLLMQMDSVWHKNIVVAEQLDTLLKIWKKEDKYTAEELEMIKENVKVLDSFLAKKGTTEITQCREKDCLVYVEIIKSTQTMYLYLDAELIDSFKVSTGMDKRYRTPDMSVMPSGPLFIKYTSKKFPAGNYRGLGNMPYAVFVRGGYAIHGTTTGNFSKLGTKASHGCIRLHPVNAKIFYELVKRIGLHNTWVTIKDSLN